MWTRRKKKIQQSLDEGKFRYKERNGSTEEGKIEGRIKVSQANNIIPS